MSKVAHRRFRFRLFGAAIACLGLSAAAAGFMALPSYRLVEDVACGHSCYLDLYLPEGRQAPSPVIVFFHGGGWQGGDRKAMRLILAKFAKKGFVVAAPGYRVYPAGRFPDFLDDGARATAWAKAHAAEWRGDPNRLFLAGYSAGAHIAAMLALDRRWLEHAGLDPHQDIAGMIGLAGPYIEFPAEVPNLAAIFGAGAAAASALPASHVDGRGPPVLLIAGADDRTVRPENAERLADLIRSRGGVAQARIYPDIDHDGLARAFFFPLRLSVPVLEDVAAFVRAQGS
jgi:acetyl esterase/lipase